jgi:hypothetical protein
MQPGVAAEESDELASLMSKVLEVETAFESLAEWEGYLKTKNSALAELVLRLYSDSNNHMTIVRSLIRKTKVSDKVVEPPADTGTFSFDGVGERGIADNILLMERMAYDLYGQIVEVVNRFGPRNMLKDGHSEEFMSEVGSLRAAEQNHIKMVEQFIDTL